MINNSRAWKTYRKGEKVQAICELEVGRSYPAMDNRRNQLRLSSRLSDWFLRRLISKEGEEVQRNREFQAKTMLTIGHNEKVSLRLTLAIHGAEW